MDNQGNRLYLNIGGQAVNNRLAGPTDRTYPTTPSTFPQPVYPPTATQQAQSSAAGIQQSQKQQPYGYGQQQQQQPGYFQPPPPPQPQQQQQQQYSAAYQGQAMPTHHTDFASGGYRSNTPGASNDPNTGLAHKFSHQNLGGAAQSGGYVSRGPSPAGPPRPRTAGGAGTPNYSYLNAPMPGQPGSKPFAPEFEAAPERNPDKFGSNANNNQKKCSQLAADFFKDSVKRARERNQR